MSTPNQPKDREQLHKKFAELGLRGYWQNERSTQRMEPKLWRWQEILPVLMETTEVIRIGPDAFRRNVGLQTGSKTLAMGFQIVLPGEAAAAHRHTNTALRFVVKGGGAYTTSNGEPMVMEPGDLLIQPNWVWHDHVNNSKEPIIWIDALDAGVVSFLDASIFREEWVEGKQQPLTKSNGAARRLYDYTLVDVAQTIDDFNLQLFDEADVIYVVMTADLSCLKNVRLVLETMDDLGYEKDKVQLVLNRSNAYTGINVGNAESALGRTIDYQVINEYRSAISALNSGEPFMSSRPDSPLGKSVLDFARAIDKVTVAAAVPARR